MKWILPSALFLGLLVIAIHALLPSDVILDLTGKINELSTPADMEHAAGETATDTANDDSKKGEGDEGDNGDQSGTAFSFAAEYFWFLVGSVPALGGFLWFRSLWVALPFKPVKLLKNFSSLTRIGDFRDKLGFRHRFGKSFGELCRALRMPGVPGLIIFIDDLDRCRAKNVLTIFETVNYFVSVGDCIVVMGLDRMQVEHSIGHELRNIADGIPEEEIPFSYGNGEDNSDADKTRKRRAYARHYMEKIINLDVTIPDMTEAAAMAMATGGSTEKNEVDPKDQIWLESRRPRLKRFLTYAKRAAGLAIALVIGVLSWNAATNLYDMQVAESAVVDQGTSNGNVEPAKTADVETPLPTAGPVEEETVVSGETTEIPDPGVSIVPSEPPHVAVEPVNSIYEDISTWSLEFLFASLILWVFLRQSYSIVANVEEDPVEFTDALVEANPVIGNVNGTPRAIKRFMNKMRFASARSWKINYPFRPLDKLAQQFDLVTEDFEDGAVSKPEITDQQIIALGALETFLQGLPDISSIQKTPTRMVNDQIKQLGGKDEVKSIGASIKVLLKNADVKKVTMQAYANILHTTITR